MSNHSFAASGGSGSAYHGKIIIRDAGFYNIACGTGGVSYGFARAATGSGGAGGASYLKKDSDGTTIVSAGGGGAGRATSVTAPYAGAAGVLTNNAEVYESYVSTNGQAGATGTGENSASASGRSSKISGKTWGATGTVTGGPSGAGDHTINASHHGFVWIKYVGAVPADYTFTINPTPADATVVLTCGTYTQQGNSISVADGMTVSWTVSKSGYTTQSGTYTVTSDYTLSVELEEFSGLPVWKFTRSGSLPVLLAGVYTTNGLVAQAAINITAIGGTIGTSGSTVSYDSNGTAYTLSHIGNETIDGKQVYIYRRSYSFIGATVYDFGYVLPESTVGSVMLYCGLVETSSRPKVTNLTSTSCSWNGNTWTRQDYEGTWTNSGVDPIP